MLFARHAFTQVSPLNDDVCATFRALCDQHAERCARYIEAEIRVLAQSLCVELGLIAREWKFMRRRRERRYIKGRAANPGPQRVVAWHAFRLTSVSYT